MQMAQQQNAMAMAQSNAMAMQGYYPQQMMQPVMMQPNQYQALGQL